MYHNMMKCGNPIEPRTAQLYRMQKTFADDVTEEANVFALRYNINTAKG